MLHPTYTISTIRMKLVFCKLHLIFRERRLQQTTLLYTILLIWYYTISYQKYIFKTNLSFFDFPALINSNESTILQPQSVSLNLNPWNFHWCSLPQSILTYSHRQKSDRFSVKFHSFKFTEMWKSLQFKELCTDFRMGKMTKVSVSVSEM